MTDTITLSREVAMQALEAFAYAEYIESPDGVPDVVFYNPLHKPNRPTLPLYTHPSAAAVQGGRLD